MPVISGISTSRIEKSTGRAVDKGKLEAGAREEILERITYTTNLADLADRQLIVETITENEPLKLEIFKMLDEVVEEDEAILAPHDITDVLELVRFGLVVPDLTTLTGER